MVCPVKTKAEKILIIAALTAGLIIFLVYIGGLRNDFVNFDDWAYVTDNTAVRTFDLQRLLTEKVPANWHPLTMVSLGVDFAFWGLDPFGYHLTNNIFHALNVFLLGMLAAGLYRLASGRQTGPYAIAVGVFSALLWGLHPQHVESVAWVSARKDVLSTFFFLLSLLFYLKYKRGSRSLFYFFSLGAFLLALLSKPMAISLPLVLLLLDLYPLKYNRQDLKALVIEKVPFFILSILFALSTLGAQDKAIISLESLDLNIRLLNSADAYLFYIYKMFVPLGLVPYYPLVAGDISPSSSLVSISVLLIISAACLFYIFKGMRAFAACWFYYLITLVPVIGLIQVGGQSAADRYSYLPGISLIIFMCAGLAYLIEKSARPKLISLVSVALMTVVLVFLSVLTIRQTAVWKDSISLWSHEIEHYPILFAYNSRALAYFTSGDYEKAIEDLNVLIESGRFEEVDAYTRRGVSYHKTGRLDLAIRDYEQALKFSPENERLYFRLGVAYFESGNMALSVMNLEKASQLGSKEAISLLSSRIE